MRILGLDISKTRTGAALGDPGAAPEFFSIVGRNETLIGAMVKLGTWLTELTKTTAVDRVYFEAMISPAAFIGEYNEEKRKVELATNPETTIALAKMVGIVEYVAARRGIEAHELNVFTARKTFLGDGRPKYPKRQAFELCRLLGWAPGNLDEADAAAIFYCGCAIEAPRLAIVASPMLQQKAASLTNGDDAVEGGQSFKLTVDARGQAHIDRREAARLFAARGRR